LRGLGARAFVNRRSPFTRRGISHYVASLVDECRRDCFGLRRRWRVRPIHLMADRERPSQGFALDRVPARLSPDTELGKNSSRAQLASRGGSQPDRSRRIGQASRNRPGLFAQHRLGSAIATLFGRRTIDLWRRSMASVTIVRAGSQVACCAVRWRSGERRRDSLVVWRKMLLADGKSAA